MKCIDMLFGQNKKFLVLKQMENIVTTTDINLRTEFLSWLCVCVARQTCLPLHSDC